MQGNLQEPREPEGAAGDAPVLPQSWELPAPPREEEGLGRAAVSGVHRTPVQAGLELRLARGRVMDAVQAEQTGVNFTKTQSLPSPELGSPWGPLPIPAP